MRGKHKEGMMSQAQDRTPSENPAETYERYFVPALFVPWTQVLLEHAAPQPGERVLDVACGTGVVARHVAPLVGPAGAVVALDISPAMIEVARSIPAAEGAPIVWTEGSAVALPYPAGAFDLVLCQQGLQFFPDRATATQEMRRVLGPHGRVALSVWQTLPQNPVHEALDSAIARYLGTTASAMATAFALGDADELRALLTAAGFQRVEVAPVTRTMRFPEPARFVQLMVLASAASVPVFAQMDAVARTALVEAVAREMEPTLRSHIDGDTVAVPLAAHIGLAHV
jgi:ubiquinone/menaquinone biosynthesis C-methylase UbiE